MHGLDTAFPENVDYGTPVPLKAASDIDFQLNENSSIAVHLRMGLLARLLSWGFRHCWPREGAYWHWFAHEWEYQHISDWSGGVFGVPVQRRGASDTLAQGGTSCLSTEMETDFGFWISVLGYPR